MTSAVDLHESEVARGLHTAVLLTVGLQRRELGSLEILVAGPLELVGPSLVAEPVANEVGITSVDEYGDLLKDAWDKQVERLHPITVEKEVAVDVEVAAVVCVDSLHAKSLHDILLVQVLVNGGKTGIAETAALAIYAYIVGITARLLVGADHLVVAVDRGGNTAQPALAFVAASNHRLTAGQGIVHALALALIENSIVAALTAGHGTVVGVLRVGVGQAVADQDGLQVDVAILVGQDLGREDGNVVASVRLAGNVEVLLGILRKLLEEQGQQRVDVLASSACVADGVAAVGVANVDGLV